ncbi:hypothetical protein H8D29_03755 [PVC group bacterium]|nr:hypothetical protein [PVC group bacterium]
MARTKNKAKRTPSVSQVKAEIAKQLTALRAHESNIQHQLSEVQSLIAMFGEQTASVTTKKRRGRKPSRKVSAVKAKTSDPSKKTVTRGRPKGSGKKNSINLSDAIQKSMRKGKNCTITEMKEGIAKVGYTSSAKNFSVIINQTLGRLMKNGIISRVDRGVYVRNGSPATKSSKPFTSAPKKEAKPEVVTVDAGSVEEWKN